MASDNSYNTCPTCGNVTADVKATRPNEAMKTSDDAMFTNPARMQQMARKAEGKATRVKYKAGQGNLGQ